MGTLLTIGWMVGRLVQGAADFITRVMQPFIDFTAGLLCLDLRLVSGFLRVVFRLFRRLVRLFFIGRGACAQSNRKYQQSGDPHRLLAVQSISQSHVMETGPSARDSSVSMVSRRSSAVFTAESSPTQ